MLDGAETVTRTAIMATASLASASYLGSTFDSITFAGSSEDFNATKSDFITTKSDLGSDFYLSTMPPPSAAGSRAMSR